MDWSGNAKSCFVTNGDSNHSQVDRESNDYYATDPRAVEKLLNVETFCNDIWECAVGEGHIAKILIKNGYKVFGTDLINRNSIYQNDILNFIFNNNIKWSGDIITNPPYKYAKEFVEKSLELIDEGHKVAMFLKLTFLEGEKRRKLFEENPPKNIYVFINRVNCALNGNESDFNKSSAVCYAWFIWEKGNKNKPIINWI